MEQSFLDNIPQRNHDYTAKWANEVIGSISDRKLLLTYRFHKGNLHDKGQLGMVVLQDDEDAPIVAAGIVAYWLHFRNNPNRLAAWGAIHKTISEIFRDYTDDMFHEYKKQFEQRPSSWRSDMEREFYMHYVIPHEQKLIKQSEALFEYISPDDQQLVRAVMKEYLEYLKMCQKEWMQKEGRTGEPEADSEGNEGQPMGEEAPAEASDECTIKLLTPLFYNEEHDARDFFKKVKGLSNQDISDMVWDFILEKKLAASNRNSKLWRILSEAKIYTAGVTNWNTALKNNPKSLEWMRQQYH